MGYNKIMESTEIISLIEQAIEARKNAYTPYSHFAVGAALLGKLAGSTQDAILKTRHTHRQIVLSGQRFLRQSARASTNFQPLPLWVAGQT